MDNNDLINKIKNNEFFQPTSELKESNIVFDENVSRFLVEQYDRFINKNSSGERESGLSGAGKYFKALLNLSDILPHIDTSKQYNTQKMSEDIEDILHWNDKYDIVSRRMHAAPAIRLSVSDYRSFFNLATELDLEPKDRLGTRLQDHSFWHHYTRVDKQTSSIEEQKSGFYDDLDSTEYTYQSGDNLSRQLHSANDCVRSVIFNDNLEEAINKTSYLYSINEDVVTNKEDQVELEKDLGNHIITAISHALTEYSFQSEYISLLKEHPFVKKVGFANAMQEGIVRANLRTKRYKSEYETVLMDNCDYLFSEEGLDRQDTKNKLTEEIESKIGKKYSHNNFNYETFDEKDIVRNRFMDRDELVGWAMNYSINNASD